MIVALNMHAECRREVDDKPLHEQARSAQPPVASEAMTSQHLTRSSAAADLGIRKPLGNV